MSVKDTLLSIAKSWCETEGKVHSTAEILEWVRERNENTYVSIRPISLEQCEPWYYDRQSGCIQNRNLSFFQITGMRQERQDGTVQTQPIILQEEIGFLGVLCREIDGVMHFLMQAKIEPGNVNCVQISPTIQATLSNFTRKHGGVSPPYLEYFLNFDRYEVVVDQIQSEQSARFYKKRNRNIMIRVEEEVPVLPSHCWMTLGQIKRLMRQDNLVNMDTRTVLHPVRQAAAHRAGAAGSVGAVSRYAAVPLPVYPHGRGRPAPDVPAAEQLQDVPVVQAGSGAAARADKLGDAGQRVGVQRAISLPGAVLRYLHRGPGGAALDAAVVCCQRHSPVRPVVL